MLLEELSNIISISSDESKVRNKILSEIKKCADLPCYIDSIGNLYCLKKGAKKTNKTIMICAHMDEVGMIVTNITEDGYLKFRCVGGIDKRVLLAKRVLVGENEVPGVIGVKAIHLQKAEERKKSIPVENMYIDIGAKDKADALNTVNLGDSIGFARNFKCFGEDLYLGKALDDRAGCAILLELLKEELPYNVYFCFTVQEEVGLRGAKVLADRLRPDIALVIETTSCQDITGSKKHQSNTRLGGGAAITIVDGGSYASNQLRKYLTQLACKHNIPYQYKTTTFGGNDAGSIVTSGNGALVETLSVPCRYIHSPSCVISKSDYDCVYQLAKVFLQSLGGLYETF